MMKTAALLAISLFALSYVESRSQAGCTPKPSHYDELGCREVLNEEQCPFRYECPERFDDADGCQYRGKIYKVGEKITEQFLPKRCDAECVCENWKDENTFKFNCRVIPKDEQDAYKAENNLVRVLDEDLDEESHLPIERCLGVPVTDSAEVTKNNKTKCTFEGIMYKIGERIIPLGVCHECICDKQLKTQNLDIFTPQCQRKQCGIGTSGAEHDYLDKGCAPVYKLTATTCCPMEWRCPTPKDVVIKSSISIPGVHNKCIFGDNTLRILDQVLYEEGDKLNCKCYIPPMVHCLKSA